MEKKLIPAIPAIVETLHVCRQTAAKLLESRTIKGGVRVGHAWRIDPEDLKRFVEQGGSDFDQTRKAA